MFHYLISIAILWSSPAIAIAKNTPTIPAKNPLSLQDYLAEFLIQNEELKKSQARAESAALDAEIQGNYFTSRLEGEYGLTEKNQSLTSLTSDNNFGIREKQSQVTGQFIQDLPFGTHLALKSSKGLEFPENRINSVDDELSLRLGISLWKNLGGRLQRAEFEQKQSLSVAAQKQFHSLLQQQCSQGLQDYANSYALQERRKIAEEKTAKAKRASQIAERAFARRLIRDLDILSARREFLAVQTESLSVEQAYRTQTAKLLISVARPNEISEFPELHVPDSVFPPDQVPATVDFESHPEFLAALAALQAAEYAAKAEGERRRSDVDLALEVGRRNGRTTSIESYRYKEDFVGLLLKVTLPVNQNVSRQIEIAHRNVKIEEAQRDLVEKNLKSSWSELRAAYELEQEKLKVSEEKIKHDLRRLDRSLELLQVGRIQYDEYFRYSQNYFTEREQILEFRISVLKSAMGLHLLAQKLPQICQMKDQG